MSPRVWIGLDPSIAGYGWAVMRQQPGGQPDVAALGTLKTRIDPKAGKLDDRARRVGELCDALIALVVEHRPSEAFVESLAFGMKTSRATASVLGRVRGITEGICRAFKVKLAEVRPDVLKLAITGHRDASKEQVARVLCKLYPYPPVFDADTNATDALAAAHVGAHRHSAGYRLEENVVRYTPPVETDEIDF